MPGKFRRTGLHRLECAAGHYSHYTVAQLERDGVPECAWCRGPIAPVKVELMEHLGVDHPAFAEYERRRLGKVQSQHRSLGAAEVMRRRNAGTLADMSDSALAEIQAELLAASRARRLAGLGMREYKSGRTVERVCVPRDPEPIPF